MNDTIQIAADATIQASQVDGAINWWLIIAIVEFIVIIALTLCKKVKSDNRRSQIKQKVKDEGDIDFANIVDSAFGADTLYKELIRKCHPDRFALDAEKTAIANDITERLGKHKNDIKKLKELKTEAVNKLNINI